MTFRTQFLGVLNRLRSLTGPDGFDLRTHSVTVRVRTWSGTEDLGPSLGVGDYSDEDVEILPRPRVREGGDRELIVDRITPEHATGGYSPQDLNPQTEIDETRQEVFYIVVGPGGTQAYALVSIDDKKAFGYELRLKQLERRVPI